MFDNKVRKLAVDIANKRPVAEFSLHDMEETLRAKMAELVCNDKGSIDFYKWSQNSPVVFELMGVMVDEVLPQNIKNVYGPVADILTTNHGDKPRFILKKGRMNVKRFVTKVAAAGVYERVRLDRDYIDVDIYAHGGAIFQTIEGFLAGRESISELLNIFIEQLEVALHEDIATALTASYARLPAANKHSVNSFVKTEFDRILNTVRAYGQPTIFCTLSFAGSLIPTDSFVSEIDKMEMRNMGYIGKYLGANVVIIPQTFKDETNTETIVNNQQAYVIPAGADEKPLKVALEGNTLIRSIDREDWSTEMQIYRKMGVALLNTNFFGIYENTAL